MMMQQLVQKSREEWSFAQRLRRIRSTNGLTQAAMAKALGVSKGAYVGWEAGSAKPSIDVVLKLRDIYGIAPSWLFETSDDLPQRDVADERLLRIFSRLLEICEQHEVAMEPLKLLRYALHLAQGEPRQDTYALEEASKVLLAFKD